MTETISKRDTRSLYSELASYMREIAAIEGAISILNWDAKTYMPEAGIGQRSEEISVLSALRHEKLISDKVRKILENIRIDKLSKYQRRNVELWKREYELTANIPLELVKKLSKQESLTEKLWEKAKSKKDFNIVRNELRKLIDLVKKKAECINPNRHPYDVLLDIYEKGLERKTVDLYFEKLKKGIKRLMEKFCDPDFNSAFVLKRKATILQQKKLSKLLLRLLGLPKKRSRLDESEHPFTTGYADDVRITTHYLRDDPIANLYSVMHEAGHAIYELNLPRRYIWTPLASAPGLAMHESQSRFIENIIGKSPEFLNFLFPKLKKLIPSFNEVEFGEFIKAINHIKPGKIRIYADEVTYNLHIVLRYEIERDIFEDKVEVRELPEIWNAKMEDYLGLKIENDTNGGVLQDTHWYGGAFGYFPDYAVGNVYGGTLLKKMKKDIDEFSELLSKGRCRIIIEWLRKNVHSYGFLYDSHELLEKVTGLKPDAAYFIEYLENKFKRIAEL